MQQTFFAGAAKVDITPTMGSNVGVDFQTHYARFFHDPLYTKVLLLKDEKLTTVIIVVDICIMSTEMMDLIKESIFIETGIDAKNILLSSTHTHAAPAVIGLLTCAPDLAYMKILPGLIVNAVKLAASKLKPALIASGHDDVPQHVRCRRYFMKPGFIAKNPITGKADKVKTNPIGVEHLIESPVAPTDPGLSFLAVKGLDGQWIAVVGNYSLHYVGDWHVDSISADYFGEFSKQIKGLLNADDEFVGMMSNGTSGDINIWDFMQPNRYPKEHLAKTKIIGNDLAVNIFNQIQKAEWDDNPSLQIEYNEIAVVVSKPTATELEAAKEIVQQNEYDTIAIDENGMRKIYAREQLLLNEYPDISTTKLQALRIGKLVIGALGGEFFAETGLWLKERMKGQNYFTITFANSYDGYVAPEHEFERGGYETWRARSSYLKAGSEEVIKNQLLKLLKNVCLKK